MNAPSKVTASHLARNAYLYVRQSSLRQVAENQESTRRQYALRQRAVAQGWREEQIQVIDCDLGLSGAFAEGRDGFQRLVAEVGLGHAGIVLGLEVSRLARNCADWHRLLEICALSRTLILDEDGLYDPAQYNDRLLLGLKGTMSEAELHLLRARLQGGLLAKARRGDLCVGLPIGLVYDAVGRVVLHPDAQVRETIALFFETFRRTGAACATIKAFGDRGLLFPAHAHRGHQSLELLWRPLTLERAVQALHNPRYAGAFAYGRWRTRGSIGGRANKIALPQDEWEVLLLDRHPGYIDWAEYERNQKRLADNTKRGLRASTRTPREGPALLQGLALCGKCGARMSVRYQLRQGRLLPRYFCCRQSMRHKQATCQSIIGEGIDEAIGQLVVDAMTPMALQLTLAVQDELRARIDEADRLRWMHVQRAEHEVELARQRYMQVDPNNRLVAASLEADWNLALHALQEAREEAERQRAADAARYDQATRDRITALATDFPAVWNDPGTPWRERKRMLALLIEDVTLLRGDRITAQVRFRGSATTTLTFPLPIKFNDERRTPAAVVAEADALLSAHTDGEVAAILAQRGHITGAGETFDGAAVAWLRNRYGLRSYKERLLDAGGLTCEQLAPMLGCSGSNLRRLARSGLVAATRCNDKGERVFAPLDAQPGPIRQLATDHARLGRTGDVHANPARGAV
jgi:DNA invertase Pin-like site-specific DNA recombinase